MQSLYHVPPYQSDEHLDDIPPHDEPPYLRDYIKSDRQCVSTTDQARVAHLDLPALSDQELWLEEHYVRSALTLAYMAAKYGARRPLRRRHGVVTDRELLRPSWSWPHERIGLDVWHEEPSHLTTWEWLRQRHRAIRAEQRRRRERGRP